MVDLSFYRSITKNRRFSVTTLSHTFTHIFDLLNLSLIPVFVGEFDLSTMQAGLVSTVFIVAGMFGSVFSGVLMNRFGNRLVMVGSLLTMGVFSLLISQAGGFYVLMGGLFSLYFASRLYCPPALSIVSESSNLGVNRGKTVGLHVSIIQLGVALGPIFLGLLMQVYDWRMAYIVLAVPLLLLVLPVASQGTATGKQVVKEEKRDAMKNSGWLPEYVTVGFLLTLIALGFNEVGLQSVSTFFTTYLTAGKGLSSSFSSILFGLRVFGVLGVSLGGVMSDRFGEKRWITLSWVGSVVTLLGVSFAPTVDLLVIFYILYNLFNYGVMASILSLVAKFTTNDRRGSGYSAYFFSKGLMSAFAPLVSAMIIDAAGIWYIFPFALAMFVISILLIQKVL